MALQYEPLADGQIRLLRFCKTRRQGLPSITEPFIDLSFTAVSATAAEPTTPFIALSYVWGDPLDTVPFEYSHGAISITRNLHAILSCLALSLEDEPTPMYLWVDAVCIDQNSLSERARQVSLMGQTYSRADSVLAFLSTISNGFEIGLSFLEAVAASPETHYEPTLEPHIKVAGGLTAQSRDLRDSLISFFAAPWWTRAWTVQEYVLAKRVIFRCGQAQIDQAVLRAAFASLRDHEMGCCWASRREADGHSKGYLDIPSTANGGLTLFQATLRIDQLDTMREAEAYDSKNLLGVLLVFRSRKCTDPRDHIYGMLGLDFGDLADDLRSRLYVDYTIPVTKLYSMTANAIIHAYDSLNVLSHICQYTAMRGQVAGLPSWVPDWSATIDEEFHHYYSMRTLRYGFYKSSGDLKPTWTELSSGRVGTKILSLGSIVATAPGYPSSDFCPAGQELLRLWQGVFCMELEGDSTSKTGSKAYEEMLHAFSNLLTGDLCHNDWGGDAVKHVQAFQAWRTWFTHDGPESLSRTVKQHARMYDDLVKGVALQRRSVRTDKGYAGFASELSETGDIVVVMPGGNVPYILRQVPREAGDSVENYRLLGDGYIRGAMLGEVLGCIQDGSDQDWEEIVMV